MIARSDGQVILVSGAVPGERVTARVERSERRLAFASVVEVSEPSIDRRAGFADPACGGCVYSHIAYSRQLTLKSEIVLDAFLRLGRITVDGPVDVAPSPERDYRMRSRFHVDGGRFGFYREGTHTLCEAAATGQVSESALRAVASAVERLSDAGARASAIELTESVDAGQRAVSITLDGNRAAAETALARIATSDGLRGCAIRTADGARVESGDPHVVDSFDVLTGGRVTHGELRRHAESFFQSNRFLVPDLVTAVLDSVTAGPVFDLYAGVGLFSIALAGAGLREITAVEGDRMSGIDLQHNARSAANAADAVGVVHDSVEHFLLASFSRPGRAGTRHRRSSTDGDFLRGDDVARENWRTPARLRVVRSGDDGSRRATAARRGIPARVAARVRSLPEHAARRVCGGVCRLEVAGVSEAGGDGVHGFHHGATELNCTGDARREHACTRDSQLGAPRFARWDSEKSMDHKHRPDPAVFVIHRPLAISRRPKPACAQHEILSVRLPLVSAPCLRGELRCLRHLPTVSILHAGARAQTLARGVDERLEERREFAGPPEVFRVPLDADAELRVLLFDRFDDAVGCGG